LPVPPPGHGSSEQHGTAYTIRAEAALRAVVLVADFRASQRVLDLGAVSVWPTTFQPVCFRRSSKLIRQSDPEGLHVSLPLSGALRTVRGEEEAEYGPDSLCVVDTSRTVDVHGGDGSLPHTGVGLEVPKALLPLPRNRLDHVTGPRLSVQEGFGALLRQLLTQLARGTDSYRPADGPRLGSVVVDLLSALFAQALEAESSLPPETRLETLVLRIRAFVRDHLHDPNLTPGAIAAANHISRSYLHAAARQVRHRRAPSVRRPHHHPRRGEQVLRSPAFSLRGGAVIVARLVVLRRVGQPGKTGRHAGGTRAGGGSRRRRRPRRLRPVAPPRTLPPRPPRPLPRRCSPPDVIAALARHGRGGPGRRAWIPRTTSSSTAPQHVQAALTCPHTLITLPETEGAGERCHMGAMSRFHQITFDRLDTTLTPATQPTS
jgi:hypothetical protein